MRFVVIEELDGKTIAVWEQLQVRVARRPGRWRQKMSSKKGRCGQWKPWWRVKKSQ